MLICPTQRAEIAFGPSKQLNSGTVFFWLENPEMYFLKLLNKNCVQTKSPNRNRKIEIVDFTLSSFIYFYSLKQSMSL